MVYRIRQGTYAKSGQSIRERGAPENCTVLSAILIKTRLEANQYSTDIYLINLVISPTLLLIYSSYFVRVRADQV